MTARRDVLGPARRSLRRLGESSEVRRMWLGFASFLFAGIWTGAPSAWVLAVAATHPGPPLAKSAVIGFAVPTLDRDGASTPTVIPEWAALETGRLEAIDSEAGAFVWRAADGRRLVAGVGDRIEGHYRVLLVRQDRVLFENVGPLVGGEPRGASLAWLDLSPRGDRPSRVRLIGRADGVRP